MNRLYHCIVLMSLLLAMTSCTRTAPATESQAASTGRAATVSIPHPTPQPLPTSDPEAAMRASMQETLDRYSRAYNINDTGLLETTYDTSNPPLRRLFANRFSAFQESVLGGVVTETYRLKQVSPLPNDFKLVTVERASDGFVADWPFREVGGRWVIAEPTAGQVGKREKTEREGFTFVTYPWNDPIKEQLIAAVLAARDTVRTKLGTVPGQPVEVVIRPTFGAGGVEGGVPTAYYTQVSQTSDRIVIYGPQSLAFVFYDPAKGWQAMMSNILVHEYTHLVTNRSFVSLSKLSDWMSEGLAEYVSDYPRPKLIRAALTQGRLLPIRAPAASGVEPRDLEHLDTLGPDRYLGYGLAYELVAYIVEKHGGLDGFWTLCRTYANNGNDLDAALETSFGVSYADFDADWQAWVRQRYGDG